MRFSEAFRQIVRLGEASRAYWDRELPRYHPDYPMVHDHDEPVPTPDEDLEIQAILRSLPDGPVHLILALAFLGRGDFPFERLRAAQDRLSRIVPTKDDAIAQLSELMALSEYLKDAEAEMRRHHIDLDQLSQLGSAS